MIHSDWVWPQMIQLKMGFLAWFPTVHDSCTSCSSWPPYFLSTVERWFQPVSCLHICQFWIGKPILPRPGEIPAPPKAWAWPRISVFLSGAPNFPVFGEHLVGKTYAKLPMNYWYLVNSGFCWCLSRYHLSLTCNFNSAIKKGHSDTYHISD